ncbi:MAG: restriction endonuclease subunit S [Saprospiraceae bacterium]
MDEHIQLRIGDILLMKDGANMGKLALVENLPGLACLNSHLLLFRSLNENGVPYFWPKYMFYHMMCQIFQDYVKVNGTGSTFLGISQESIGNYPICLPVIEDQKAIAKFLDKQSSKFDQSISLKEQEIEKLKEYKATLINSAVTGKIKVC